MVLRNCIQCNVAIDAGNPRKPFKLCHPCRVQNQRDRCKAYKAKNRKHIAEYNKVYKKENKEDISTYNANYFNTHKNEIYIRRNKYFDNNPSFKKNAQT